MFKNRPSDLAVLGGSCAFPEPLHVGRPNIPSRDRLFARLNEILDLKWLTNDGKYVREFERAVSEYLGVRHCIPVCNGTIGLELALRATEVTGEVLVPAFTFIATAHAPTLCGLEPVFVDVDLRSHLMSVEAAEAAITPKTKAILAVHTWGQACYPEQLKALADRHGLVLLFDAAHAFGCAHAGKPIGSLGHAEIFSFHATKFLNSFEGGMVSTNDDVVAHRIRRMKNFGFAGVDRVDFIGTNGKMSEVSAAMGLTSLEQVDEFIAVNRNNHTAYREAFAALPGMRLLEYPQEEPNNYQYVVLEVDEELSPLSRDNLVALLWSENVLARRYFHPGCHRSEPYASSGRTWNLPNTEKLTRSVMILPNGTAVGREEIAEIAHIVRIALLDPAAVRNALEAAL